MPQIIRLCPGCRRPGWPHNSVDECVRYLGLTDLPHALRLIADEIYRFRATFDRGTPEEYALTTASTLLHELAALLVAVPFPPT